MRKLATKFARWILADERLAEQAQVKRLAAERDRVREAASGWRDRCGVLDRENDALAAKAANAEVEKQNVARNLDAALFGVDQKLALAVELFTPEQLELHNTRLDNLGGAGTPSMLPPEADKAQAERVRKARAERGRIA